MREFTTPHGVTCSQMQEGNSDRKVQGCPKMTGDLCWAVNSVLEEYIVKARYHHQNAEVQLGAKKFITVNTNMLKPCHPRDGN